MENLVKQLSESEQLHRKHLGGIMITLTIISAILILNCVITNGNLDGSSAKESRYSEKPSVNTIKAVTYSDSIKENISDKTTIDSTSIGSTLTRQEVQKLIELHNKVRADVGVGPLNWSKKLAAYAQEWANHLAVTGCKMEHRPNSGKWKQGYGENLFMGTSGYYGVADAVKSWESEKKYYHGQTIDTSNVYKLGHYTQIVWENTKQIGCAKIECNGNIIVVCNYDPPGNFLGQKPYKLPEIKK
jgi:pathogenesis-related protein 1